MIEYKKLRERLNKKLDMALKIAKARQEVLDDRDLENDNSHSWTEINFAEKFLLLEYSQHIKESNKNPIKY